MSATISPAVSSAASPNSAVPSAPRGGAPNTAATDAASGFAFSVSISVSVGAAIQTAASSTQAQDGSQALATLQQAQQAVRDATRSDAAAKLDEAIKELSLLKILGNTLAGASEAVKLAKQIAAAAKEYAAAGGASPGSLSTVSSDLARVTAALGDIGTTANDPTDAASAQTAAQQDPFYGIAGAALAALRKYLQKTLPPLQNSSDPKTRAAARQLGKEFAHAENAIDEAEASGGQTAGATDTSGASDATTVAAVAVAATASVTVDLVA
jgi:hypothetical protein